MKLHLSLVLICALFGGLLPANQDFVFHDNRYVGPHVGLGAGELRRLEDALSLSDREANERLGRFLWWEQWKKRPQIGASVEIGLPGKKRVVRHHTVRRVRLVTPARQPKLNLNLDQFTFERAFANPEEKSKGDAGGAEAGGERANLANAPSLLPTAQISGRLAISSDGNNHDCDDITASAMTVALLAKTGNASKLVYYGHSDHHWSSNTVETCGGVTDREEEMRISTEETAELWGGFNMSVFVNARANKATAISNLTAAINASSAGDRLTIIAAGPMDIVGQALNTAGANKDHVTVISHSEWNDNHSDTPEGGEASHSGWTWAEMQSAFTTVTFTHIADQNAGLTVAESNYFWLRDSSDAKLTWIWDRHIVGAEGPTDGHFDPSDAGMLYFLLTGDQGATPRKIRFILEPNVYPGAAWDTATPAEMGFNAGEFAAALAALPDKSIVIRNGYVVGTKGNVTTTGLTWSASKSLVSLLFARQLQLGAVTYDSTIPGSDVPSAPLATYRQFLSMTSDFHLTPHAPGDHYAYNNGGYHHVGTYLKNTFYAGRTHAQTLQDAYVTQLSFEDAFDYPSTTFAGDNHMSGWNGGWSMSTRDMARIGYLVLRNGNWKGQQLLSANHIADLYTDQIPNAATFSTDTGDQFYNQSDAVGSSMSGMFSYGFWLGHGGFGGSSEVIVMSGAFGTRTWISRLHNIVVVHVNTGGTDTNPGPSMTGAQYDALINALESSPTTPSTTYYVRNGGSQSCTGTVNADYPGSGSGQPCAFSSVNAAISAATWGNTIKLHAGQTFDAPGPTTSFDLIDKGTPPTNTDADYITITTDDPSGTPSALSNYPQSDTRITTAMAANMPRVRAVIGAGYPVIWVNRNSEYWKIKGLNITNVPGSSTVRLIGLGEENPVGIAGYPRKIIIEENWMHPAEETGELLTAATLHRTAENALYLEGVDITIRKNAFQGFVGKYSDGSNFSTSVLTMTTYSDNVVVENNLMEAWTYTTFFGGGSRGIPDPAKVATVSSCNSTSCVFTNTNGIVPGMPISIGVYPIVLGGENTFDWGTARVASIVGSTVNLQAPLCNSNNTGGNGNICMPFDSNNPQQIPSNGNPARWEGYQVSNVLVRRNIIAHRDEWIPLMGNQCGGKGYLEVKSCHNCTFDANIFKGCDGLTITTRNQAGADPWNDLDNLTFSNNWFHRSNSPLTAYLNDDGNLTERTIGYTFHNNLVTGEYANPDEFNFLRILSGNFNGGTNARITHNTIFIGSFRGFSTNNTTSGRMQGLTIENNIIRASLNLCFDGLMTACWPSAVVRKNVLMYIDPANSTPDEIQQTWTTPFPDNSLTTSVAAVGFISPTPTLDHLGNYELALTSPFKGTASDGTDPGVNFPQLITAFGFNPFTGGSAPSVTVCKWSSTPTCQQQ